MIPTHIWCDFLIRILCCGFFPWLDCNVEKWCQDLCLDHAALLTADTLHSQLINILKRIELPISVPAFGSRNNTLNIKRALLAGFFMQVRLISLDNTVFFSSYSKNLSIEVQYFWFCRKGRRLQEIENSSQFS